MAQELALNRLQRVAKAAYENFQRSQRSYRLWEDASEHEQEEWYEIVKAVAFEIALGGE